MWIFAGIGGALGALCRYAIGVTLVKYNSFFWGTLLVNVLGSFFLGLLMGLRIQEVLGLAGWVFMAEGFLGAFTTFSTFSYESFTLFQSGKKAKAVTNVLVNLLFCILLAYLGFKVAL